MADMTVHRAQRAIRAGLLTLSAGSYAFEDLAGLIEPVIGRNTRQAMRELVKAGTVGSFVVRGQEWLEVSPEWIRTVGTFNGAEWPGPPLYPKPLAPRQRRNAHANEDPARCRRVALGALATLEEGDYDFDDLVVALGDVLLPSGYEVGERRAIEVLRWAEENQKVFFSSAVVYIGPDQPGRDAVMVTVDPDFLVVDPHWYEGPPLQLAGGLAGGASFPPVWMKPRLDWSMDEIRLPTVPPAMTPPAWTPMPPLPPRSRSD